MIFGCCTDISYYDRLVESGYDSICLSAAKIYGLRDDEVQEYKRIIKDGPLKALSLNGYYSEKVFLNGPKYSPEIVYQYTDVICRRGSEMGFRYLGIGAPAARNVPKEGEYDSYLAQFTGALRIMCEAASKYRMQILLESVCGMECNFIKTTREALQIVKRLEIDNLALVYDIYHEYMEKQPLEVISECSDYIKVVHIAQDNGGKRYYLDDEHVEEYRQYYAALKNIGYKGELNIESFVGNPDEEIPKSLKILKKL